jgi:hypothetical protein
MLSIHQEWTIVHAGLPYIVTVGVCFAAFPHRDNAEFDRQLAQLLELL